MDMNKVTLGEFRVYIGEKEKFEIFSKRRAGRWPNMDEVMEILKMKLEGEGEQGRNHVHEDQNENSMVGEGKQEDSIQRGGDQEESMIGAENADS